jgi:two-component system response regulator FixJ
MTSTNDWRRPITISDERLAARCARGRIVIIDDDAEVLGALALAIEMEGYACEAYPSAVDYLHVLNYNRPCFPGPCCVLCDVKMPELDGLELLERLGSLDETPLVLISGNSGVEEAVTAFRGGALDFLIKPIDVDSLLACVIKALALSADRQAGRVRQKALAARIASLTEREREIASLVTAGQSNPVIAERLGIALRTVKLHRQRAMEKIGAHCVADLIRIADETGL